MKTDIIWQESLGLALSRAYRGDEDARGRAVMLMLKLMRTRSDETRNYVTLKFLRVIDGGRIDPSRPATFKRYVEMAIRSTILDYLRKESTEKRRHGEFIVDAIVRENWPRSEPLREMRLNDTTLQHLADTARAMGTPRGAIVATAASLGITRQTLRKRVRKIIEGKCLSDFKEKDWTL
ncbi:hypothetical protein LCGC14_0413910 [marine sediment metagenome]|uniref:Uncharacterized protein n=1 Tax=marine sediment metagenome TaxID=412755 RepID=A0A0F9SSY8_9ZZZZ